MSRVTAMRRRRAFYFLVPILLLAFGQLFCEKHVNLTPPVALRQNLKVPFKFVVYGDTRFTSPSDTDASNPDVREALVRAVANAHPNFICIDGDITYNGYEEADWRVWDDETAIWRQNHIPVFPVLGNHDLHGDQQLALRNYFARFPELHGSRFYSLRAANVLFLMLDSSLEEVSGVQGSWLQNELAKVPAGVDFIVVQLHHPPYTSSSDMKRYGGGHSARKEEQELAKMLEAAQANMRSRVLVFAGHVHNYERHEHGGVTYFVSGGGGAHAYPIERAPKDPFQSNQVNYHYLLVTVERTKMKIEMNRLELSGGKEHWTQPDQVSISLP